MAVVHIHPLRPTVPIRRVRRRKTRRRSIEPARPRRSAERASWLRTLIAALRALLAEMGRRLTTDFTSKGLTALAGVACLVIDCVALGAAFVG